MSVETLPRKSITVGKKYALPSGQADLVWSSDSDIIKIDKDSYTALEDRVGKLSRVKLEGKNSKNKTIATNQVTIVPWEVRDDSLDIKNENFGKVILIYKKKKQIFFIDGKGLFVTEDNFKTSKKLYDFKIKQRYRTDYPLIEKTRAGYFWSGENELIFSKDLKNWRSVKMLDKRVLFNGICSKKIDGSSDSYVFLAEYSLDADHLHKVWRGRFTKNGSLKSEKIVIKFDPSEAVEKSEKYSFPIVRHLHAIVIDPHTGWLWLATGDKDWESGLWISRNDGITWERFATGKQDYRALSVWFTEKFVYWNMDTHSHIQKIYRADKSKIVKNGKVNPITPLINRGKMEIGKTYMVLQNNSKSFKKKANKIFVAENESEIKDVKLLELENSKCDYSEIVATLPYGAQWYTIAIKDKNGSNWNLMSASPESRVPNSSEVPFRDWNCRLFMFREREDSSFECFEAHTSEPNPEVIEPKFLRYHRIDPRFQDDDGTIYLNCHNSVYEGVITASVNL